MGEDFLAFVRGHFPEILKETFQHIWLTFMALGIATVLGVTTGILITRFKKGANWVLGVVNIIQTIPSLALLGFLLPFIGIGNTPAILALFLYALLPIVRNTFTGIEGVSPSVKEAALAMGLSNGQLLTKVELPLAAPVIFAGIRTATVLCIGVATLCAYVAAGGLGAFIFRGIALNNSSMILAGALPAALLALLFDLLLSSLQKLLKRALVPVALGMVLVFATVALMPFFKAQSVGNQLTGGFHPEFMEREDGYFGLAEEYGLEMNTVELDAGLMYQALKEGKVDVIGGYSSDGRIGAYDLLVLEDDRNYFPPYFAVPLVNSKTLVKYPKLEEVLDMLAGQITDAEMRKMNYEVDDQGKQPKEVAKIFLEAKGFSTAIVRQGQGEVRIGGKNFTEQYILAEIYALLVENYTDLDAATTTGLGGTQICFEALKAGEIDMYPEYTGTGLLVLLNPDEQTVQKIIRERQKVYEYVKAESARQFDLKWLSPLGFNNAYALMVRKGFAERNGLSSISDLAEFLQNRKE